MGNLLSQLYGSASYLTAQYTNVKSVSQTTELRQYFSTKTTRVVG
jgi:hypothetical protein